MSELKKVIEANAKEIESVEIYSNGASIEVKNEPQNASIKNL